MNDEPTTYRIERCEHDTDKHPNAIVMGGHFVGRLEEHLPNCDGSRLVMVECMEAELVVDGRLQAIADAARCEHGNIYRHQIAWADGGIGWYSNDEWCEGAPELAALLDALGGTDNG